MRNKFRFGASIIAILVLSACSQDPTTVAKELLTERCTNESAGYLRLTKFAKDDGVMQKINGVDYYSLQYSIEAEGVKDGGYLFLCKGEGKNGALQNFKVSNTQNENKCNVFPVEMGHRYVFNKHGTFTDPLTHKMTLAKHENGWVMQK